MTKLADYHVCQPSVRANALSDHRAVTMLAEFKKFATQPNEAVMNLSDDEAVALAKAVFAHFRKKAAARKAASAPAVTLDTISDRVAASIAKINASPFRTPTDYQDLMQRHALANELAIAKATGKAPRVQLAQPAGGDGNGDDDEPMSKKIARLMKERGWGIGKFDLAASEVLRGLGLHGEVYGKPVHAKPGSRPLSP